jgi:hypothetical protein
MPASYAMTWEPRTHRWRKMHLGVSYVVSVRQLKRGGYLSTDAVETKESSYRAANQWWQDRTKQGVGPRPGLPPYHPHESELAFLERQREWYGRHGDHAEAQRVEDQIAEVRRLGQDQNAIIDRDGRVHERVQIARSLGIVVPEDLDPFAARIVFGDEDLWRDRFRHDGRDPIPDGRTVGDWIEKYLDTTIGRHRANEISAAEYQHTELSLNAFKEWLGSSSPIDSIDSDGWVWC